MPLFLGVDGGQSSTTALIGDERGHILGMGRGGPCNHVKGGDGREKFVGAISKCLQEAARAAHLDGAALRFESACLGFSGGPADKQAILAEMIQADHLVVTHDALIGLVGATGGAPGIITIAGTGSIAFGRNAALKTSRAGGWGYVFGDEGGAFDLARQALRAALRMEEGWGPNTLLHALLMEATNSNSANDLLHHFYTTEWPRPRVAALSRLVDEAALSGDEVAGQLLKNAAQYLATFATCVRTQLFGEGEAAMVCAIGGVFKSDALRHHFTSLMELTTGNTVAVPRHGPAAGALLEAYRAAGQSIVLQSPPSEKE